ncbi:MAG: ABC transporter substrate-binding protein [Dehalococcoidia bacterium]
MNANQHPGAARGPDRRRFLRGGVGALAGSAAYLLACGGDDDQEEAQTTTTSGTAAAGTTSGETPKRGGRLGRVWTNNSPNLNPLTNFPEGAILSAVNVYDRLISVRPGKDYVTEAAQSVEQPDPTTVIFKLKPGMTYQNRAPVSGRAVSSEDIAKFQILVKDYPGAGNSFQRDSMQSVEAPDAQTVVFKLKAPNAYLFSLSQLAGGGTQAIIPQELHDNLDSNWPVGSGPYELAEYQLSTRYLYKRFDGYREASRDLPYVDERLYQVLGDPTAQDAAFRSGQIDLWESGGPTPQTADLLKREMAGKIEMDEYPALTTISFSANATKPPFNDVRVREAIYRILNRQQYIDLVEAGRGSISTGLLAVGLKDFLLDTKQTEKFWKQDPKAAKQLLDAAGFPFDREFEVTTANAPPRNPQNLEVFQEQASQVGIKARLLPLPATEWLTQRLQTGNWDIWISFAPGAETPQTPLRLQHTNTNSVHVYNGLKDPQTDAMIEKAEVTVDRNERIKLVNEIQLALLEKYTPYFLMYTPTAYLPRWKHVMDYELSIGDAGPLYQAQVWLDK